MTVDHQYLTYGSLASSDEVARLMAHLFACNEEAEAAGRPKTPLCIWGTHGIGKTSVVTDYARAHRLPLVYLAPAQFEEMGDLLGMPELSRSEEGRTVTTFRPPEWVPTEGGPGIVLMDDANRADIRILRGIMQLLQRYEVASWALPPHWQIVLTANPDGGDYAVTTMDGAMLTRMMHVTMRFDVQAWARWAERSGVDPRGIDFVLTHPELVKGDRSTPRSFTQFFEMIAPIEDLEGELALVAMLAHASLEDTTARAFQAFVQHKLSRLVQPAEILAAEDFDVEVDRRLRPVVAGKHRRLDILGAVTTRVVNAIESTPALLDARGVENLKRFVKLDYMPNDMRLTLAQELVRLEGEARLLLTDPEIARLLLQKM